MTKEVYDKSVDVLLDAYNKEELFHGDCNACAVGNLMGNSDKWKFITGVTDRVGNIWTPEDWCNEAESGRLLISDSGLGVTELSDIEHAFEMSISNDRSYYTDKGEKKGQYLGLVAVLDVMKDMVETEVEHEENIEKLETIYATFQ